jgi:hypothetical protein
LKLRPGTVLARNLFSISLHTRKQFKVQKFIENTILLEKGEINFIRILMSISMQ